MTQTGLQGQKGGTDGKHCKCDQVARTQQGPSLKCKTSLQLPLFYPVGYHDICYPSLAKNKSFFTSVSTQAVLHIDSEFNIRYATYSNNVSHWKLTCPVL